MSGKPANHWCILQIAFSNKRILNINQWQRFIMLRKYMLVFTHFFIAKYIQIMFYISLGPMHISYKAVQWQFIATKCIIQCCVEHMHLIFFFFFILVRLEWCFCSYFIACSYWTWNYLHSSNWSTWVKTGNLR